MDNKTRYDQIRQSSDEESMTNVDLPLLESTKQPKGNKSIKRYIRPFCVHSMISATYLIFLSLIWSKAPQPPTLAGYYPRYLYCKKNFYS
jgi:hypothetical protein